MKESTAKQAAQDLKPIKPLDRDDHKPLYAQLHENIKQYIQENNLKPGDRIPSENELIMRYGLSRMTVRLATQGLASEGIITRIRGKGTFVAEPKVQDHPQGTQSLEMRFGRQGKEITNVLLEEGFAYTASIYTKGLNLPQNSQVYKVRRLKRMGDSVLGLETRLFSPGMKGQFSTEDLNNYAFIDILSRQPESKIHRISYWVSCDIVTELEAELLNLPPDSPVLVQHGIFYNVENLPIMTGRIVYPADKMEIHYEISALDSGAMSRDLF